MGDIYYFGCRAPRSAGHYLFARGMKNLWESNLLDRLRDEHGAHLDAGYLRTRNVPDRPGLAAFVQVKGHSVVTWWDRSGDQRGNSNSAFIVPGDHTPQEVMRLGAEHFPDILKRQQASITLPDGTVLH